jgi:hypothetical protein
MSSKPITAALHRHFFFTAPWAPASWALLARIYRNRPFFTLLERSLALEGDVLECGVFWGRSAVSMARRIKQAGQSKTVFALDSYNGFEENSIEQVDLGRNRTMEKVRGRFKQAPHIVTDLRHLAARLGIALEVVPGFFENTLENVVKGRRFSFIHLDCDIYSSYKTCLPLAYQALVPGGIMLFDEYRSPVWPGATQAIDEFFLDKPERPEICDDPSRPNNPKYFIVKC